jgi:hypothetical protein
MKRIKLFEEFTNEGFFTKDKGPIKKEDLEKSKYIQQMKSRAGGVGYANDLIDKVIKDVNELNSTTNRKTMIDEIVLFVSRIVSNYETRPTEKEYSNEFNHFIK